MKLKVVLDSTKSDAILNLIEGCDKHELVIFDFKFTKEKKNGYKLLSKYGAMTLPFLVFEKKIEDKLVEFNPCWIGDTGKCPTIDEINKILNGEN